MSAYQNIAAVFRQARLDAGMTQKEVADRLCITAGTLCHYEQGVGYLTLHRFVQLCNLYGLTRKERRELLDLFGGAA